MEARTIKTSNEKYPFKKKVVADNLCPRCGTKEELFCPCIRHIWFNSAFGFMLLLWGMGISTYALCMKRLKKFKRGWWWIKFSPLLFFNLFDLGEQKQHSFWQRQIPIYSVYYPTSKILGHYGQHYYRVLIFQYHLSSRSSQGSYFCYGG